MRAHVVYVSPQQPRVVIQAAGRYVVVESQSQAAIADTDEISGDLTLHNVKWLLNLTRSSLVNIKVLGRYSALEAALEAVLLTRPAAAVAVPANLVRSINRNRAGAGARTEIGQRSATTHCNAVPGEHEGVAERPQPYLAGDVRRPRQEAASR